MLKIRPTLIATRGLPHAASFRTTIGAHPQKARLRPSLRSARFQGSDCVPHGCRYAALIVRYRLGQAERMRHQAILQKVRLAEPRRYCLSYMATYLSNIHHTGMHYCTLLIQLHTAALIIYESMYFRRHTPSLTIQRCPCPPSVTLSQRVLM